MYSLQVDMCTPVNIVIFDESKMFTTSFISMFFWHMGPLGPTSKVSVSILILWCTKQKGPPNNVVETKTIPEKEI